MCRPDVLLLLFLATGHVTGIVFWVKSNGKDLLCLSTDELKWQNSSTKVNSDECRAIGETVYCNCSDCSSLTETRQKMWLKQPLNIIAPKIAKRLADCLNRFSLPNVTDQTFNGIKFNKWYALKTLRIDHKTTEKQLEMAMRIVEIKEGLSVVGSRLRNLSMLALILRNRGLEFNGKLEVLNNPNLESVDDLLLFGFDSIEIRNNSKLKISWPVLKEIKDNYLVYRRFKGGEELGDNLDRFKFDYMNHKCPAPNVLKGELAKMDGSCYVLEGDLKLTRLTEQDSHYSLEKLERVLYIAGSLHYSHDKTSNYRLQYLRNLVSIDNGKKAAPALVVTDVRKRVLDLPKSLFEVKCGQGLCVQADMAVFNDHHNGNNMRILKHASHGRKDSIREWKEQSADDGEEEKSNTLAVFLNVWTTVLVLALGGLLFASNCLFEWHKPKSERRRGGRMPLQRIFSKKGGDQSSLRSYRGGGEKDSSGVTSTTNSAGRSAATKTGQSKGESQ